VRPYPDAGVHHSQSQDHGLERALDRKLIELAAPALDKSKDRGGRPARVEIELPVVNTNRTIGALLTHELMKARGEHGLPDDTIHIKLAGSAGQSFGAFVARGITLELEGDANDYVGKGLSGGRIIVYPSKQSRFLAEENVIIGNVALYGATSGDAFFRGRAAERFCVRNSGARTVVEGVGDHGCEYMTGGRAVILGPTGRNFAAGMSGGVAWVLDPCAELRRRLNPEMVQLETVTDGPNADELRELLEQHLRLTGSAVAARLLERWATAIEEFVQVMPSDYKLVLAEEQRKQAAFAAG
jgi:glutamate synthase domain-containing protein 3